MAKGIRFQDQSSNPLPNIGDKGLWVNNTNNLIFEKGASNQNITSSIDTLLAGTGFSAITRNYINISGSTIPAGTAVYSPSVGNITLADGITETQSRVIGITAESINPATSGKVAIAGAVTVTGLIHGNMAYLGDSGVILDAPPENPIYPEGFNLIQLGVIEGNNLILQIIPIGTL